MDEKPFEKIIEKEFAFLFEAGFCYEYTYDKGSDSSCVYIYRFRRGRDFFDFRTVSGNCRPPVLHSPAQAGTTRWVERNSLDNCFASTATSYAIAHPLDERLPGHYHPAADTQHRETQLVHRLIPAGG